MKGKSRASNTTIRQCQETFVFAENHSQVISNYHGSKVCIKPEKWKADG